MSPNGPSGKDPDDVGAVAAGDSKPGTKPDEARTEDPITTGSGNDQTKDGTEATPGPVGVEAAPAKEDLPEDQDELRKQIEETRAELGDTVEALSAKADVKTQAKAKVDERKDQLRGQQDQAKAKVSGYQAKAKENPTPVAAGAGGLLALLLLIFFLRRRD
ncbi:MAG: DUF3618 domain-containing protein [Thermoleophilaceae bacterium]